jgi:hypothetical protein
VVRHGFIEVVDLEKDRFGPHDPSGTIFSDFHLFTVATSLADANPPSFGSREVSRERRKPLLISIVLGPT